MYGTKMMNIAMTLVAGLVSVMPTALAQATKPVYAHFMLGIVENFTLDDWKVDIAQAKAIGIDGFALNCAPPRIDSYTPKQLALAYQAAEELNFTMFISFDFAYWSTGDTELITDIVGNYSAHPAQAYYDGGAIVSTFVGDSMDWKVVKNALPDHKITALPMIQDPSYIPNANTGLDGAFSWYAWATDGGNSVIPGPMTTIWDDRFLQNLGNKPYMAPVSPWFSTHFNTKNWVFIAEEQPMRRWEQMLQMQPDLIEIITWNDFGESHYISDNQPNHSDDGSSAWAAGFPHGAWRDLMKPYIAAYKSGASSPTVESDQLIYWFRPHPKDAACSSDPLGAPRGKELLADAVFTTTLLTETAELTVTSGNQKPVTVTAEAGIHTFNFTMGVGAQEFRLARGGQNFLGGVSEKEISGTCATFNYNVYAGSF